MEKIKKILIAKNSKKNINRKKFNAKRIKQENI